MAQFTRIDTQDPPGRDAYAETSSRTIGTVVTTIIAPPNLTHRQYIVTGMWAYNTRDVNTSIDILVSNENITDAVFHTQIIPAKKTIEIINLDTPLYWFSETFADGNSFSLDAQASAASSINLTTCYIYWQ